MNILCVIDSLGSGGAQRQLVELALGFKERGHTVSLLVYHENNFFQSILEDHSIPIFGVYEQNYLVRLLKMVRLIKRGNYDCVLSYLEASNFICELASLVSSNMRVIVGERSANPNILKSFKLIFYRWFHFLADYVVCNTNANLNLIKKANPILPTQKCRVIYNAVPKKFVKQSQIRPFMRDGVLKIVVGASHQFLKNSASLVAAINLLPPHFKAKVRVHWYGDKVSPPYFDGSFLNSMNLVQEYALEDVIKFFPATRDIEAHMAEADVIGLFSIYEGLPNLICEAMYLGKPVMVSDVSDMRILLSHEQRQIFNPLDVSSIKDTIEWYLALSEIEVNDIGQQNFEVAKKHFNRDYVISQYLNLMAP